MASGTRMCSAPEPLKKCHIWCWSTENGSFSDEEQVQRVISVVFLNGWLSFGKLATIWSSCWSAMRWNSTFLSGCHQQLWCSEERSGYDANRRGHCEHWIHPTRIPASLLTHLLSVADLVECKSGMSRCLLLIWLLCPDELGWWKTPPAFQGCCQDPKAILRKGKARGTERNSCTFSACFLHPRRTFQPPGTREQYRCLQKYRLNSWENPKSWSLTIPSHQASQTQKKEPKFSAASRQNLSRLSHICHHNHCEAHHQTPEEISEPWSEHDWRCETGSSESFWLDGSQCDSTRQGKLYVTRGDG